jgi:hypothetical protein
MSTVVHLPWSFLAFRAACGLVDPDRTTTTYEDVTCMKCRGTRKWKERLVKQADTSKTEGHYWLNDGQRDAVDRHRRAASRESVRLIVAGRPTEALSLMKVSLARQIRLAGLDRAVRESREKEMIG